MGLLDALTRAALVVVDVQEGFRPYDVLRGASPARAASSCRRARIIGLPALVTEQYPKGLGHTAPEVGLGERAGDREDACSRPRAPRAST